MKVKMILLLGVMLSVTLFVGDILGPKKDVIKELVEITGSAQIGEMFVGLFTEEMINAAVDRVMFK